jgi:hypothetical protein
VGAGGVSAKDRALDARKRRQREMANPDNEVRPSIHGNTFAHPLDHPLFEMKTDCVPGCGSDAHLIKIV